jgi:magnesium transporter
MTGSRIRSNDVSFLLYSLLDAIVDDFFPLLERCAERIQKLERRVLVRPTRKLLARIHRLRHDIMTIRRVAWPMRELILELRREEHECFSENTRTYLRDVYDHILVVFELIESYRDVLSTLTETYMSAVSNRMNDIMKTLTIISTIFVPLTFLAGVYGMNMPIPENEFRWSYPIFWAVSLTVIGSMVWWFRSRHWF